MDAAAAREGPFVAAPDHAEAAVVIPCIEIETLTIKCVEECRRLFPQAEIIVLSDVPGNEEALAREARVIVTGRITIPAKRNRGARETRRKIIGFIDSDAYPAAAWLDDAVRALREHPEIGAVAGPNVSPPDQNPSERYVGIALRSSICAHNAHYIKRPAASRIVDNMPSSNLIVRRNEFLAMGGMDETLYGGEDVEFCQRLVATGRHILYLPTVLVYHKNRRFKQFVLQRLAYGGITVVAILKSPSRTFFVTMMPAAMFLFLLTGLALPWMPWWSWIYVPVLAFYLAVSAIEAFRHSAHLTDVPGAFAAIIVATLAPGIGATAKIVGLLPEFRRIYRNDR